MAQTLHIIVAAGKGSRFGADLPKQFCRLGGRPVVAHAIAAIKAAAYPADLVAVVISPEMEPLWRELVAPLPEAEGVMLLPVGGATRVASVANALAATAEVEASVISIHDGARPLVDVATVRRVIDAVVATGRGALPAIALTDSIRRLLPGDGSQSCAVDRASYRAVQTPQAFPASYLRTAYEAADPTDASLTDDASVYERFVRRPSLVLVEGSPYNIKVTNSRDLIIAEALMASVSVK
ncbi:MAG: 2-C-methyl-D-erythritol 4-phosphate cytidylyltransferase [Pseudoflavonifractor sp.]|nr:2-C-methyl-D-erythritol 4-phosphate cytidylyltransferase [Alloprevotella sp.]MCM1116833.1 2-C-methyl-D-erythritol 4-phosphate cytidylyltransferase [Pseudoflavonifractor sp.]